MNDWLAIPLEARLGGLFVLGVVLGALINLAVDQLSLVGRHLSPWMPAPPNLPPRTWLDRIPLYGWLRRRRESKVLGLGFWVRPLLVELLMGVGLATLYWWEVVEGALLLPQIPLAAVPESVLHAQFSSHLLLIVLMMLASLIDIDEQIIPDRITIPGTVLGLVLAAMLPWSLLPSMEIVPAVGIGMPPTFKYAFLKLTSPLPWSSLLDGREGLFLGLGCFWIWCLGLLPRVWRPRRGYRRAFQIFVAHLRREAEFCGGVVFLALLGSVGIITAWVRNGLAWQGLLTALVGLAIGGGMIWLVRIIGRATLGREAMGFGDVTLMAMIGSFLGWQSSLIIFFLAPFAGLVIGIVQLLLRRGDVIPYGPFLCLAALFVLVQWSAVWNWGWDVFALGWWIPAILLVCMALMGGLLLLMRLVIPRRNED